MGFSAKQLRALKRNPHPRSIRTRLTGNRELSYIEGWYAITEANRIFGHDGWSRETLESKSVLARETRGTFLAIYLARVRITVKVRGTTVIREGHGTGEGRGPSPHDVHDIALKAAETDATKRALATFGRPFGLELYRNGKTATTKSPPLSPSSPSQPDVGVGPRSGFHPDDATPIPRPSRYYGQRSGPSLLETMRQDQQEPAMPGTEPPTAALALTAGSGPHAPPLTPTPDDLRPRRIDKSQLAIAEPKRIRDKAHLKFVAAHPCFVCGRQPSDPHHLRFAQPRAIGMKASDEFTVPLCRGHHRELHRCGDEQVWWEKQRLEPMATALKLWRQSHPFTEPAQKRAAASAPLSKRGDRSLTEP